MALILSRKRLYGGMKSGEDFSSIRLIIGKEILSNPYDLSGGTKIKGELLKVFESRDMRDKYLSEIPSFEIELFLFSANASSDSLYFSKKSWEKLRDYGVLADSFLVEIKIKEVEPADGAKIEIYPNRDVEI